MKYAHELKHCKSVRAVALIDMADCRQVGKIVGHWSDNPAGSVVTVTLWQWSGEPMVQTATAGGYGYDKFGDALQRLTWGGERIPLNGVESWFEARGVRYVGVL